jgi:Uncharacterized protein conserved in bacteria
MKKFGYVMAPKVLVVNKLKVCFMYREKPDNTNDSGWRLFSGEEDQEYVDNPNNIAIYDINTILAFDKDIEILLSSPVGSAYEREDPNQEFVPSADFEISDVE